MSDLYYDYDYDYDYDCDYHYDHYYLDLDCGTYDNEDKFHLNNVIDYRGYEWVHGVLHQLKGIEFRKELAGGQYLFTDTVPSYSTDAAEILDVGMLHSIANTHGFPWIEAQLLLNRNIRFRLSLAKDNPPLIEQEEPF